MDALQAHQVGFANVVAIMGHGRSLSGQVSFGRNLTRKYAIALDQDAAGEEATRRSLEAAWDIFRQLIMRVRGFAGPIGVRRELPKLRIITLPAGLDPDDVIRNDPDDWRSRVEQATPILDFLIRSETAGRETDSAEGRREAIERLLPLIRQIEDQYEQQRSIC